MLSVELRKKSIKELIELEEKSRAELFALKFQSSLGNNEKPHRIKELKIIIARILTILSEKKISGEIINKNIKIDLSNTFKSIEENTRKLFRRRKQEAEKLMKDQKKSIENPLLNDDETNSMSNLMLEQLNEEVNIDNKNIPEIKKSTELELSKIDKNKKTTSSTKKTSNKQTEIKKEVKSTTNSTLKKDVKTNKIVDKKPKTKIIVTDKKLKVDIKNDKMSTNQKQEKKDIVKKEVKSTTNSTLKKDVKTNKIVDKKPKTKEIEKSKQLNTILRKKEVIKMPKKELEEKIEIVKIDLEKDRDYIELYKILSTNNNFEKIINIKNADKNLKLKELKKSYIRILAPLNEKEQSKLDEDRIMLLKSNLTIEDVRYMNEFIINPKNKKIFGIINNQGVKK